jgi:hypothetical protein
LIEKQPNRPLPLHKVFASASSVVESRALRREILQQLFDNEQVINKVGSADFGFGMLVETFADYGVCS